MVAQHDHLAGIRHPEAFEDLDGRRLARTVRPEHSETLPDPDLEVEAGHRVHVAVLLDEAATEKRRARAHRRLPRPMRARRRRLERRLVTNQAHASLPL